MGYSWFTWRREWQPTLVFLLGEFHGQRTLVSCSSWGCKELDMTKWLTHRYIIDLMGSHGGSAVKSLPAMQETWVQSLGWEDPLEKKMATHSSILAWRIHRQRSLVCYNSLGCNELDRTEWVHTIIVGVYWVNFKCIANDSVIHIFLSIVFQILLPYRLLQSTE